MGYLGTRRAVVEDIDAVERDGRVEEMRANCGVACRCRLEVGLIAGRLIEQDRRLDRIRVGLERLQVVELAAGCW